MSKRKTEETMVSGKLIIVSVFALALLGAGFSWAVRWKATHRTAVFWSAEAIATIQKPHRIIAMRLGKPRPHAAPEPNGETPQPLPRDPSPQNEIVAGLNVVVKRDITHAPGVTHLRQALLEDRSFDWNAKAPPDEPLGYCLQFFTKDDERCLTIFFTQDFSWMKQKMADANSNSWRLESYSSVSTAPLADGLRQYFDDVVPSE